MCAFYECLLACCSRRFCLLRKWFGGEKHAKKELRSSVL